MLKPFVISIALITSATICAAETYSYGQVGSGNTTTPGAVETIVFDIKEGVDYAALAKRLYEIGDFNNSRGTLFYRTVALNDETQRGIIVNYWRDEAAMDEVNAAFVTNPVQDILDFFGANVDMSTIKFEVFDIK